MAEATPTMAVVTAAPGEPKDAPEALTDTVEGAEIADAKLPKTPVATLVVPELLLGLLLLAKASLLCITQSGNFVPQRLQDH